MTGARHLLTDDGTRKKRLPAAVLAGVLLAMFVWAGATGGAEAKWTDKSSASTTLIATKWATPVCVTWSNEARPDAVFTIGASTPLGSQGWTQIVDKKNAKSTADLAGCAIMLVASEAWGLTADQRVLAVAWFNAGGKVMTTGNDNGSGAYPLPEMIQSVGPLATLPYAGNIRRASTADTVTPRFPTWTPGPVAQVDKEGIPVTFTAAGTTCVATVANNPGWCAAITKTNAKGGRWVHLHTKIGSMSQPGDHSMADAALAWLIS